MSHLETSTAVGVAGLAVFQLVDLWTDHAPTLEQCRAALPGDVHLRNRLLDSEILAAGIAVLVGGALRYTSGTWTPALLLGATLGGLAFWYSAVLNAHSTAITGGTTDDGN